MASDISRREALARAGATLGAAAAILTADQVLAADAPKSTAPAGKPQFRFCLNTSTIRGQKLPLPEVVAIAGQAGYDGIEPWIGEIEEHLKAGSNLKDLKKQIADAGLTVESAIGFAEWVVDDDAKRAKGLERARHDMDLVRQIGGSRIAAPPAGAYEAANLDLFAAAQRYRALGEIGDSIGIVPQVEFWGGSKSLYRLAQSVFVAVESGYQNACLLPDVYHLFRGGSDFAGLALLDGQAMHCFHMNDYPGDIPREKQDDSHRVYPGDGVAPLAEMLRTLHANGFSGALSLELFNRDYWSQDAAQVAKTGLEKMHECVHDAFA